jgi:hypothetical protein
MAIRNRYFPGTAVSRHLDTYERSWNEAVYQSGKPVLDSELILSQEVGFEINRIIQNAATPSGWVRGASNRDPLLDFQDGTSPNTLNLLRGTAIVANMPVVVEYTGTSVPGENVLTFSSAPVYGGAPPDVKRTDFVFLEVWACVVSTSPRATATVEIITNANITAGDQILINGVPLTATAGVPLVDEFQIGANGAITAANIFVAINNPANSFVGICSATVSPTNTSLVNLRAADPFAGAAGNALTLSQILTTPGCIQLNGGPGPTLFSGGADTPNKPSQSTIYRLGNTQADPSVNFTDDIADPVVGTETTKRVQVQYRIRITGQTEAVNFKQQNGFDNPLVLARGTQAAPVAGYPFVPADGSTVSGNSSAANYATQDSGLWVAGDGTLSSANALGTVDGYVYAIPIAMVFRRNDAYNGGAGGGYDPLSNTNGALPSTHPGFVNPSIGVIPVGASDRPDGRFHDLLLRADVMDLRKKIFPGGLDLKAELESQMAALLDGNFLTWAIDGADKNQLGGGSGDVSTRYLVCNEIGRSSAKGGVSPSSGSTPRGDSIGDFDHVRRRFGDWAVVERRIFPILPTSDIATEPGLYTVKANPLLPNTWEEGDQINIDLNALDATGLGNWLNAPSGAPIGGGSVADLWPLGTKISDVLRVIHDDGNYGAAISKQVQIASITGVGTPHVQISLSENTDLATGGIVAPPYSLVGASGRALDQNSPRRIWVELEITYPTGSGTTDTVDLEVSPDPLVYPVGPILEDDTTQRPADFEGVLPPAYRVGRREVSIEYIANDGSGALSGNPILDTFVSDGPLEATFERRIFGSIGGTLLVTDAVTAAPVTPDLTTTEFGSSSRKVFIDPATPLSGAGQTLINVEYFAQDPLPNYGAVGYQIAVYYRSNAPQTLGVQAGAPVTFPIPAILQVRPFVMSKDLWTCTVSVGSPDLAYPYSVPSDQIAVNGDVPVGDFPGEWALAAFSPISIGNFDASTGLLNLHQLVPVDCNSQFQFQSRDVDQEFRAHYKVADPNSYRPTAAAQPLSGVQTHKVWFPFLARAVSDSTLYRKGEVLLIVVSRFAHLQENNVVAFTDSSNTTCAALYRTRGCLLLASE